ncbi:hypothetical protein Riv7116_5287 [Rivularia sp. PCC 7116]|uniref:hypothetical protein n=1 Tax=Rivularia sp. PCC 7116 TaxID=373994 RepID=UPI00029EEEB4|nr:hypothetical protein [Rivularia sp. PCC 7116]AFY57670.1 hypothetical protein Riv7116_5287 [Rivularia sp. PCC 7116]
MKTNLFVSFLVLSTSFFVDIPSVNGEPANIFKPLVNDISLELSPGLSMRLPSYIPASDTPIYPFVTSDEKGLRVNISTEPDCEYKANPLSCIIGEISAIPTKAVKHWPPKGDNRRQVNLDNGINGFFFTRGKGDGIVSFVAWEQDNQKFGIFALSEIASRKELLDIAKSMTGEEAIKSKSASRGQ